MKKLIFLIWILSLVYVTQAADRYVRKGASGSGTSWTDAWDDFDDVSWTGMSSSTLWVAAGSYTGTIPDVDVTSLTIKRAAVASHGTETGWNAAYDGQVTIDPSNGFYIWDTADGFTLDGISNNPWKFKIVGVTGYNGMLAVLGASNVTIRNVEFDGNSELNSDGEPEDGVRIANYNGVATTIVFEYNYVHHYVQKSLAEVPNPAHNDGVQAPSGANLTFRYNIFVNNGQHLFIGDCEWSSQYVNGLSIHHNLFYNTASSSYASYNTVVLKGTNFDGTTPTYVDNNTFAVRSTEYPEEGFRNAIGFSGDTFSDPVTGTCNRVTGSYVRNNIFYYSTPGSAVTFPHSYNLYSNSGTPPTETGRVITDPLFTNYSGYDHTLQSGSPARDAGTNIAAYTSDLIGTVVPQNSTTDIGSYEYIASSYSNCDINEDSSVNSTDVQVLLNCILAANCTKGDLDSNSSYNILDLQKLISVILTRTTCP